MEQTKMIIVDKDTYMQRSQARCVVPLQNCYSMCLISCLGGHEAHVAPAIYSLLMLYPPSLCHGMSVYLCEHSFLLISETFGPLKLKWISVFFIY